jgi:hypothetical protein
MASSARLRCLGGRSPVSVARGMTGGPLAAAAAAAARRTHIAPRPGPQAQQQQQRRQRQRLTSCTAALVCAPAGAPARPQRGALHVAAAVRAKSKRQVVVSKTLIARPDAAPEVERLCAEVTAFGQTRMDERGGGVHAFDCVRDQWEVRQGGRWGREVWRGAGLPERIKGPEAPGCGQGVHACRPPRGSPSTIAHAGRPPHRHGCAPCLLAAGTRASPRAPAPPPPAPPGPAPAPPSSPPPPPPPVSPAQPNVFHFWERYDSNVVMGRINTAPEVVKFMEKVGPLQLKLLSRWNPAMMPCNQNPAILPYTSTPPQRHAWVSCHQAPTPLPPGRRVGPCSKPAAPTRHAAASPQACAPLAPRRTSHLYRGSSLQVAPLLEKPVGMALYEWQDGQLGPVCLQGGECGARQRGPRGSEGDATAGPAPGASPRLCAAAHCSGPRGCGPQHMKHP